MGVAAVSESGICVGIAVAIESDTEPDAEHKLPFRGEPPELD